MSRTMSIAVSLNVSAGVTDNAPSFRIILAQTQKQQRGGGADGGALLT